MKRRITAIIEKDKLYITIEFLVEKKMISKSFSFEEYTSALEWARTVEAPESK